MVDMGGMAIRMLWDDQQGVYMNLSSKRFSDTDEDEQHGEHDEDNDDGGDDNDGDGHHNDV